MEKKKNRLDSFFNVLLLVLLFVVMALMMYLSLTGKINLETGAIIMMGCAMAIALILYLLNAKKSAYGGRFKHNYPDAKND